MNIRKSVIIAGYFTSVFLLGSFCITVSDSSAAFGDLIGTYNGENLYSNETVAYYSCNSDSNCRSNWGVKWQCVEFVNRYYNRVMGMPNWGGSGDAYKYWETYQAKGLERFENGKDVPKVNDILVWNTSVGGGSGHVAIITEVYSDRVRVAEQNWNNRNAFRDINRNGNTIQSPGLLGWLRKQSLSRPSPPKLLGVE